ncbi:uL15 family ribosomal protein [Candidatus Micrarchaeota archaeon]|nr:uL15 family ribosomal protein [Candidatus Micrarchaeota archaeon]
MVEKRKQKRRRKFLGSGSYGKGNAKNNRGKGNKGGWGRAGMGKHRMTYITSKEPDFLIRGGFTMPNAKHLKCLNVFELEQKALAGKLASKDGKLFFEFAGKVLGSGKLSHAVHVRAISFAAGAKEKIEKAGGKAESIAPAQEALQEKEKTQ